MTDEATENTENTTPDWKALLPEDMKDNPSLRDFKDLPSLAKSYLETKSLVGGSIRIPGEDAGEEDWNAFNQKLTERVPGLVKMPDPDDKEGQKALWSRLGRPATDEGYTLPEGVEDRQRFLDAAKRMGLTNSQLQEYVALETDGKREAFEAAQEAQNQSKAEVLGEWGAAKEQKLRQIRIMLESTGAPEPLKQVVNDLNVDGDFLRWAETVVQSIGGKEDAPFSTDGGSEPAGMLTPDEAEAQISEIMGNSSHPYHNKMDPAHKKAVQKMVDLFDLKAGRKPTNRIA
jgi:DNA-binding transcriptional MerR regulator